jgi:hypothetical protein
VSNIVEPLGTRVEALSLDVKGGTSIINGWFYMLVDYDERVYGLVHPEPLHLGRTYIVSGIVAEHRQTNYGIMTVILPHTITLYEEIPG